MVKIESSVDEYLAQVIEQGARACQMKPDEFVGLLVTDSVVRVLRNQNLGGWNQKLVDMGG